MQRIDGVRRAQLRALHHDRNRTQLLDAAEVVFGDKGMHASTIKEIAELAGCSVGSVYSYVAGKDDLLTEVLARRGREMIEGMARIAATDAPPLDRLVALTRYEVAFFAERPAFARLYLRIAPVGALVPEGVDTDQLAFDEAMAHTTAIIGEGQRRGDIVAGPPSLLARVLSGIVTSYQSMRSSDGAGVEGFGPEALAALVLRTFSTTAITTNDSTTPAT